MIRVHFVAVLLAFAVLAGCRQSAYEHEYDDYAARYTDGWQRTIGTDFLAGNNEYLYFNGLAMEWSADAPGSGYLHTSKPGKDIIAWTFEGQPNRSRTIPVRDGTTLTCTHTSGATFEMEVVKQTKYYIKVFYRPQGGDTDQSEPE